MSNVDQTVPPEASEDLPAPKRVPLRQQLTRTSKVAIVSVIVAVAVLSAVGLPFFGFFPVPLLLLAAVVTGLLLWRGRAADRAVTVLLIVVSGLAFLAASTGDLAGALLAGGAHAGPARGCLFLAFLLSLAIWVLTIVCSRRARKQGTFAWPIAVAGGLVMGAFEVIGFLAAATANVGS